MAASSPAPLAAPALALALGIALPAGGGGAGVVLLAGLGLLGGLLLIARSAQRLTLTAVLIAALLAGVLRYLGATHLPADHIAHVTPPHDAEPILTRLLVQVASVPRESAALRPNPFYGLPQERRTHFVARVIALRVAAAPAPLSGLLHVHVRGEMPGAQVGQRLLLTGWLAALDPARNPGAPDWARLSRLQGIHSTLRVDAGLIEPDAERLSAWMGWRQRLAARLLAPHLPADDASTGLLEAIVLGQRSAVSASINDAFVRTGTVHFLSVSGFHVGVLAMATWWSALTVLRLGRRAASVVVMVVLLAYLLIAEPNPPVLRATVMGLLACLTQLAQRPVAGVNWLALAAILLLLWQPLDLLTAGFQLSFLQVFALLTLYPRLHELMLYARGVLPDQPRDMHNLWGLLLCKLGGLTASAGLVSLVAWAVSLPLVLHHFGQWTPWGALQSLLLTPLAALVVLLGLPVALLGLVWADAAALAGQALTLCAAAMSDLANWLASWPGTHQRAAAMPAWGVVVSYVLTAPLLRTLRSSAASDAASRALTTPVAPQAAWTFVSTLAIVCWIIVQPLLSPRPRAAVHVMDVGDGSATLLVSEAGQGLLIDCGTLANFDAGRTVDDALRPLGVRALTWVALSHSNSDHYAGLPTLLAERILPLHSTVPLLRERHDDARLSKLVQRLPPGQVWEPLRAGDRIDHAGYRLRVLWPPERLPGGWSANDSSLVLMAEVNGNRVLIPGDIEAEAMRALLADHAEERVDLRCDVLIAPHHGSVRPRETQTFYRAANPRLVIASHQRPQKLGPALRGWLPAAKHYSTRENGAVSVDLDRAGALGVRVMKPASGAAVQE